MRAAGTFAASDLVFLRASLLRPLPIPFFAHALLSQVKNCCRRFLCVTYPRIRTDCWKGQRNFQGVLGVHLDDLDGGGNLTFQKAVQWLRSEQDDLDVPLEAIVQSQFRGGVGQLQWLQLQ